MAALLCDVCGAPLPAPSPGAPHVVCAFCRSASALDPAGVSLVSPAAQASAVALRARHAAELEAFEEAFAREPAANPADALRAAAAAALGELCDPATLTAVVIGMARAFASTGGVDLTQQRGALPRLATSYLAALEPLRAEGTHRLRIPFIAATDGGPVDFEMTLTVARIRELAELGAGPPRKRRGLLGRLFGRG